MHMEQQQKSLTGLYTIGEAADILGVSIQTLRLYEREGLIISIRRSTRHRRYNGADLERVRALRKMINQDKISVAEIKRLLARIPCWSMRDCPQSVRDNCAAFQQEDKPCWLITDKPFDCRNAECHTCEVYTSSANAEFLKQSTPAQAAGR